MVLSEEVQTLMQVLLQAAKVITNMMNTFLPTINQLQRYLNTIEDLNLMADRDFTKVRSVLVCLTFKFTIRPLSLCHMTSGFLFLHMLKVVKWMKTSNFLFSQMVRGQSDSMPSQATFVTLSRALCTNGILALFGIAQMPIVSELSPSISDSVQREEMIDRFKIPRNACTSAGKTFTL